MPLHEHHEDHEEAMQQFGFNDSLKEMAEERILVWDSDDDDADVLHSGDGDATNITKHDRDIHKSVEVSETCRSQISTRGTNYTCAIQHRGVSCSSATSARIRNAPPSTITRAASCAYALLERQSAPEITTVERRACAGQLRKIGGAYRALVEGSSFSMWVRYAEMNADIIAETESYFASEATQYKQNSPKTEDGFHVVKDSTRHVKIELRTQSNGACACGNASPLRPGLKRQERPLGGSEKSGATPKESVTAECGKQVDGFELSPGERLAISLLESEDEASIRSTLHATYTAPRLYPSSPCSVCRPPDHNCARDGRQSSSGESAGVSDFSLASLYGHEEKRMRAPVLKRPRPSTRAPESNLQDVCSASRRLEFDNCAAGDDTPQQWGSPLRVSSLSSCVVAAHTERTSQEWLHFRQHSLAVPFF